VLTSRFRARSLIDCAQAPLRLSLALSLARNPDRSNPIDLLVHFSLLSLSNQARAARRPRSADMA